MDQGDDSIILEGGEDMPPEPAEPPAEFKEELGMFACGDRDIYEDDPPLVLASPSLYGLSQLVQDVNSSPTQEDPRVPACSPRTEAALQPVFSGLVDRV